jgi:hypothetical protein
VRLAGLRCNAIPVAVGRAQLHAEHLIMARRRENPVAAIKKRLPHKALLKRDEPFSRADSEELEEMCRRIADGADHFAYAGSRGDENGCRVLCFDTAEKARAMQAWIEASGIASRSRRPISRNSSSADRPSRGLCPRRSP